MNWLKSLYPKVNDLLISSIPTYWPEFTLAVEGELNGRLPTEVALPLAACRAAGGTADNAVPLTSALLCLSISMRILDDIQDRDRDGQLWQRVGQARAFNYATSAQFLSFEIIRQANYSPQVFQQINTSMLSAALHTCAGQDKDLIGNSKTLTAYWETIEMKTATAYSLACANGAQIATHDEEIIRACGLFGHHLGLVIQIFNDLESIWDSEGEVLSDLEQGKITLPLLYGSAFEHPKQEILNEWIEQGLIKENAQEIVDILNDLETKEFIIWLAIKEREAALKELKSLPDEEGKKALEAYLTSMFGDIDRVLNKTPEVSSEK